MVHANAPVPTTDEIIQVAKDLLPRLRERADWVDRERRLPVETYRELQQSGLLQIFKPKAYGGFELGPHEHAMVTLHLARACASTAWVFSLLNADSLFVLAFSKQAQDDLWGKNTLATLAGSIYSDRKHSAAARATGGYRLTGRWGFNSGSQHAEWLVFNSFAEGSDQPSLFLVPKEDCTLVDDWFTLGMRGTCSQSITLKEVFVPAHRVIPGADLYTGGKFTELHPSFDMLQCRNGLTGLYLLSAVAVGVALGAVDFFVEKEHDAERLTSVMGGAARITDSESILAKFAECEAEADLARFRIEHGSRVASERVHQRQAPSMDQIIRENRDNSYLTSLSMRCVDRLHGILGAKACFEGHPLARAVRDVHTIATHVTLNWERTAAAFAKNVLKVG
jgi:alkylation response protein AidB-like acyl-CoA dehydrogenase